MYKHTSQRFIGCGNPSLDVVQVEYNKDNSPYHADVVHALIELQREGWVRSIVGSDIPIKMMNKIEQECGINLDGNQVRGNLIDPNEYLNQLRLGEKEDMKSPKRSIHVTSPLAGGILSDTMVLWPHNWRNYQGVPQWQRAKSTVPWHYRNSILHNWRRTLNDEKEQLLFPSKKTGMNPYARGKVSTWVKFEQITLMTLQRIAQKHGVSVSSVALRWLLQSGPLASIVLGTSLNAKEGDDRPFRRPSELRQVFKFMLDDQDMEELWNVSGRDEDTINPHEMPDESHDFSNRKLWL
jgi:diketogulonate reductase-like aldo/keto reductase